MSNAKVFISYSHDSDAHREKVLALSERLRADGLETLLDQYVNGSPEQGWPRWMLDQLDAASFVLVICTETYYRRFRGHEEPGKGKGVESIALLGRDGGFTKGIATVDLIVRGTVTARIQEGQKVLYHVLCEMVEEKLPKA